MYCPWKGGEAALAKLKTTVTKVLPADQRVLRRIVDAGGCRLEAFFGNGGGGLRAGLRNAAASKAAAAGWAAYSRSLAASRAAVVEARAARAAEAEAAARAAEAAALAAEEAKNDPEAAAAQAKAAKAEAKKKKKGRGSTSGRKKTAPRSSVANLAAARAESEAEEGGAEGGEQRAWETEFTAVFDNSVDPVLRCVVSEGPSVGERATVLLTTTSFTGLVTRFDSGGGITQRQCGLAAAPGAARAAATSSDTPCEVSRTVVACGHVVVRLRNGASHVLCPGGNTASRSADGVWTSVDLAAATLTTSARGSGEATVVPLQVRRGVDGESGAKILAYEGPGAIGRVVVSRYSDGLESVVFVDGTNIESRDYDALKLSGGSNGGGLAQSDAGETFAQGTDAEGTSEFANAAAIDRASETLVVCVSNAARGFAPVMLDCSVDRNAQRNAAGQRIDVSKGGLRLRSRTTLPDATEVTVAYDFDATTDERGSVRLERNDRTGFIVSDIGELLIMTDSAFIHEISQRHRASAIAAELAGQAEGAEGAAGSSPAGGSPRGASAGGGVSPRSGGSREEEPSEDRILFNHDSLEHAEAADASTRERLQLVDYWTAAVAGRAAAAASRPTTVRSGRPKSPSARNARAKSPLRKGKRPASSRAKSNDGIKVELARDAIFNANGLGTVERVRDALYTFNVKGGFVDVQDQEHNHYRLAMEGVPSCSLAGELLAMGDLPAVPAVINFPMPPRLFVLTVRVPSSVVLLPSSFTAVVCASLFSLCAHRARLLFLLASCRIRWHSIPATPSLPLRSARQ